MPTSASKFNEIRRTTSFSRKRGIKLATNERRSDVARRLRDIISTWLRQKYSETELVTTEDKLLGELHASRNSIRAALDMLRHENRVMRRRGQGSSSVQQRVKFEWSDRLTDSESPTARHEVLNLAVLELPPTYLVEWFALRPDEAILLIERRSIDDGEPTSLRTIYLRTNKHSELQDEDFTGDLYSILARLKFDVGGAALYVEGALADERVGEILQVVKGSPVLLLENHTSDADGRLLFISYGRIRADRRGLMFSKDAMGAHHYPLYPRRTGETTHPEPGGSFTGHQRAD